MNFLYGILTRVTPPVMTNYGSEMNFFYDILTRVTPPVMTNYISLVLIIKVS